MMLGALALLVPTAIQLFAGQQLVSLLDKVATVMTIADA